MKRIFAIIICCVLAFLLFLGVFAGFFMRGSATVPSTNGTVKVILSSTSLTVAQGKTVVVKVSLELSNFYSFDGIYSFADLPIEYNLSLFEYKSSAVLGTLDDKELTILEPDKYSNKVYISFETLSNKPINKSMDLATITFQATTTSLGNGSFDVGEPYQAFANEDIEYSQIPSSPLNIEVSDRLSSNTFLTSLSLQEANLKPSFRKDTYNYTATVDFTTSKVNPIYISEDSSATVSFTGNGNLKIGENIVSVIVTAADGTTKTYKIIVTRTQNVASKNISDVVPNNDNVTGSDLEKAKLEGERIAIDAFNIELEREKNRNFLIDLFLIFVILCELFYIILLKYGTVLFKGKRNNPNNRK